MTGRVLNEVHDQRRSPTLLEAVLEGWDEIVDEDGTAVPFTAANRQGFLDDPYFCRGVIKAYLESLDGAQVKN